jgi:xanthine/uracil permease
MMSAQAAATAEPGVPLAAAPAGRHGADEQAFDIGIHEKLGLNQLALLGVQNVFGMIGMFIFPALFGRAFNLSVDQIAYLYGTTFIVSGVVTALQATVLKLPIVHGPYVGSFAALLAVGHLPDGGLDLAFGSFMVASLIWAALALPIRGFSVCGYFARFMEAPIITGTMVILAMVQVANTSLPNWLGNPTSAGFPGVNLLAGAITIAGLIIVTIWGGTRLRRGAILVGLVCGTLAYSLFVPISLAGVARAPWLVEPQFFPFGLRVRADMVAVFVLVLVPASIGSMALYKVVGRWGNDDPSAARMSMGLLTVAFGGLLASVIGGFSTQVYPDNIGMLRSTRVGSRYAVLAAGAILVVLGACVKFDMLLVAVPQPVVSAAATLLFGIVLVHGIAILGKVHWDDRNLVIVGFALLMGLGALFVPPETMKALPLVVQLLLRQSVVIGGIPLILLHLLLDRPTQAAGTAH